jgi:CubicO group peptidase (beta-lactamase class C family)
MLTDIRHDLQRSTPEQQGVATAAVLRFVEALDSQINELHSFMLLRHGSVVAEGWWSPYGPQQPHWLYSLSKSFTSTAVGLALAEGRFSIDDPVFAFFPDETPVEAADFLKALQVRHLLSMSTGHAVDSWPTMVARPDGNWISGFFEVPLLHTPGTHFLYNTGASYMLAAILQKTTGMKLVDYLKPRLLDPLGIQTPTWQESPQGIAMGGIGLSLRTEDIARFGQLYLQKGQWQGNRLLPETWVDEAVSLHLPNGDEPQSDWTQGYGYQFWRCRYGAYRGDGAFGQYCIVMPEQDAVLAMTGGIALEGMQEPLDLLWELLLPAMRDETPLAEDVVSQHRLSEKVASLALPPVPGNATAALAAQVSGRTYRVDANPLAIESLCLDFTGAGCTSRISTAAGEETLTCAYGSWAEGQTRLLTPHEWVGPLPFVASGAWTAEDRFTMLVRLYETPFYYTLVYHFVGGELLVEIDVNVSFESSQTLLTAQLM